MEKFWKYKLDHLTFWVITVGFHFYTAASLAETAGWVHLILEIIIRNGLLALLIYANLEYLVPKYVQQRKFLAYTVGLTACFVIYVLAKDTHDAFLTVYAGRVPLTFWQYSFYNFSIALFYVTFSLALQLSKAWYFQRQRLREVEIERLNTELEYLKAQINPHFLFNSLNTIFFQIDKANVHARETLTKFSDMLRYQLYECNEKKIPLEREIQYLRNYIDLQRLRKDEKYEIEFITTGHWGDATISPLLLLPLVENAFKYVSHFSDRNRVKVDLKIGNKELHVRVMNTIEAQMTKAEVGGIGLKNLKRRLELEYHGMHSLEIVQTEDRFEANLKLNTRQ